MAHNEGGRKNNRRPMEYNTQKKKGKKKNGQTEAWKEESVLSTT